MIKTITEQKKSIPLISKLRESLSIGSKVVFNYDFNKHADEDDEDIDKYSSIDGTEVTISGDDTNGYYWVKDTRGLEYLAHKSELTESVMKESKVDCFTLNRTGMSYYDTFVDPDDKINSRTTSADYYKFEKGVTGRIVYMTPDEYFEECAKYVFDKPVEKIKVGLDQDNIDKYAEDLKSGVKYRLPFIDYANELQEGRHRMMAVKKVFGDDAEVPVLIVELSDPTEEEIIDYVKRRWNTDDPYWINYVKSGLDSYHNSLSNSKYHG